VPRGIIVTGCELRIDGGVTAAPTFRRDESTAALIPVVVEASGVRSPISSRGVPNSTDVAPTP
jgi:hypothetical protein